MEWIRSVNPNGHTLESWMRENDYTGQMDLSTLKNVEERETLRLNEEKISSL